ncbi:hypothetical protein E2C01_102770 [Portunus trituberculatus]|uniref:Uncharacterized protein n=1 Tax=Portunus trituberculatus TaxID=210409 RepID=A0A5B7KE39_PORTR|nr:hypothetical protein [Portunus trituberculatus]
MATLLVWGVNHCCLASS